MGIGDYERKRVLVDRGEVRSKQNDNPNLLFIFIYFKKIKNWICW